MQDISLKKFIASWQEKSKKYDQTTLHGTFDRFFTLFVLFNALYSEATSRLIETGKISRKNYGDREMAIQNTIIYIGADNLFSEFKKNCSHEINKISKLIEDNIFFIHYRRKSSEPDHDSDIKFVKAIASDDSEKYCTELLKIVYTIRCNMFHGEKEYSTIQMELLQPTTEILEIVINELLKIINYSK